MSWFCCFDISATIIHTERTAVDFVLRRIATITVSSLNTYKRYFISQLAFMHPACLQHRTDRLFAGLRKAYQSFPTTRAERTRIPKTGLSDEQRSLWALRARLSAQAQRGVSDEPSGSFWGTGSAETLAEGFIAFPPQARRLNERSRYLTK